MPHKLLVGPILGLEGNNVYTVCFLTGKDISSAELVLDGISISVKEVETLPDGKFWRAEAQVDIKKSEQGRQIQYEIYLNGRTAPDWFGRSQWEFYIPAIGESPKFAYTSCNGVSKSDLIAKMGEPFRLWREMVALHQEQPFSLLLMGGDQIYADSIWEKVDALNDWANLKTADQVRRKSSKKLSSQLDAFYSKLYKQRWVEESMSYMLASVPSIMMWDDHDIFDGWGSFPKELQQSPVFSEIFKYAKKYFELFQIRTRDNSSLISHDGEHYSFCIKFRDYTIVGLDNRSQRSITQVMGPTQWQQVIKHLDTVTEGDLLVMSAVPVVYRDFSFTETVYDITPWQEDLADDLKDHWRAKEHQGERNRLIMRLLGNAKLRNDKEAGDSGSSARTIILSGDVHVGCLGVINDRRHDAPVKIHQIVSSGV